MALNGTTEEESSVARTTSESRSLLTDAMTPRSGRLALLDRVCRRLVHGRLSAVPGGRIDVVDDVGTETFGGRETDDLSVVLRVHDPRTYRAVCGGGTIGAAEAYADGWWEADDLTALIRLMARHRDVANGLEGWSTWLAWIGHLTSFRLRSNRRSQSRRNIAAHYDLGNDFFASFLDRTMTYSCAVFPHQASTLEDGSRHKLDLVCRKLELSEDDELLEIGTGWGSLAIHAASSYGCRVVTTTISREQYAHVTQAVQEAGLDDRVTVITADYRDLPRLLDRRFDKVVSIEMIEAVGYRYLDRFFEVCDRMTKPGGAMLLQSIVIADALYDAYRGSVDVIQRYIFPGGFLPSLGDLQRRVASGTRFQLTDLHDITEHYPKTLRLWRERLLASRPRLRELGYPDALLRMWEYYFCYCEGGFLEQTIGDVQLLLAKPGT